MNTRAGVAIALSTTGRTAMREAKGYWQGNQQQYQEAFRATLNKTALRERLFDDKFIEGLERRRARGLG